MSLLSRRAFEKIPDFAKPAIQYTNKRIKFADGSCQSSSGIVTFDIQIGDNISQIDFLLGDYTDEAILGMSDITKLSLSIDFSNLLVTQGENWLPIHDVQQCLVGRKVLVRKTTVIPAHSRIVLQAYVENMGRQCAYTENPILLETKIASDTGIIPVDSLHQEIDENIPVMVFNTSDKCSEITCDTILGHFVETDCISDFQDETEYIRQFDCVPETDMEHNAHSAAQPSAAGEQSDIPEHLITMYENNSKDLNESQKRQFRLFLQHECNEWCRL